MFNKELSEDRQNYDMLMDDKEAMERAHTKKMTQTAIRHDERVKTLELQQEQKIESEQARYTDLQRKFNIGVEKWQEVLARRQDQYRAEKDALAIESSDNMSTEASEIRGIQKAKAVIEVEFEEAKRMYAVICLVFLFFFECL